MTHIGFDRTEQCRFVGGAPAPHHTAERIGLDRITQDRAGAVRLDVVHGARIDASIAIGTTQYVCLGIRVGCQ